MSQPASPQLSKGYAALFATVVIWSLPSLFQFFLNRYYDVWAQNFYRYSVACLAIAPVVFYQIRRGGLDVDPPSRNQPSHKATARRALHAFAICLLPCIPNVVHQITQVVALFYIGPGVYSIFIRSSVIFTALLALAFFPEERPIIRQWQFQAGTVCGLLGAFGVIWFQPNGQGLALSAGPMTRGTIWTGFLTAFTASFCWALYGVLVKRPSAKLGPIRSFGIVSFITSALLLPLTLAFGRIGTPLHAGAEVNFILIISAVSCITLAHVLYYVAIQEIGVALAQTLQLVSPVVALALSGWIFHERLTTAQVISAVILLAGAFLAMRVKPVTTIEAAENL
jgi:drug/metabolite transporter (DMT)-like permease